MVGLNREFAAMMARVKALVSIAAEFLGKLKLENQRLFLALSRRRLKSHKLGRTLVLFSRRSPRNAFLHDLWTKF